MLPSTVGDFSSRSEDLERRLKGDFDLFSSVHNTHKSFQAQQPQSKNKTASAGHCTQFEIIWVFFCTIKFVILVVYTSYEWFTSCNKTHVRTRAYERRVAVS